ncbi:MAG: gamma-glutamylcyclotransferase [Pseudomonas sp.]|uniref:gamma-glutamylcyclotransferase family protein n=1 Tax=Halopseudomonas sp. TaxID=2901191 RepID=UPI001A6024C0|nr:gamma-glutamylcyclotransferase [Pseudomonas sp.]|tara:strand:- start:1908 stop:2288 length:381 start_codon:yes stop_codon:yes gene_type:complete
MSDMQPLKHRVAVYGTLKRGMSNHDLLQASSFLGEDTLTNVTLYDLGLFPAAKFEASHGITVELFEIDDATLTCLDRLEGYRPHAPEQSFYHRHRIDTRHGDAWVYIYCGGVEFWDPIRKGAWMPD